MRGVAGLKGALLAVANLLVIVIGIGVVENDPAAATLVALAYGIVPTAALGGLFGLLVDRPTRSRHWRVLLALGAVALPAIGLVVAGVRVVVVPTFLLAVVLERWTRRVVPAPVPVATALSSSR